MQTNVRLKNKKKTTGNGLSSFAKKMFFSTSENFWNLSFLRFKEQVGAVRIVTKFRYCSLHCTECMHAPKVNANAFYRLNIPFHHCCWDTGTTVLGTYTLWKIRCVRIGEYATLLLLLLLLTKSHSRMCVFKVNKQMKCTFRTQIAAVFVQLLIWQQTNELRSNIHKSFDVRWIFDLNLSVFFWMFSNKNRCFVSAAVQIVD